MCVRGCGAYHSFFAFGISSKPKKNSVMLKYVLFIQGASPLLAHAPPWGFQMTPWSMPFRIFGGGFCNSAETTFHLLFKMSICGPACANTLKNVRQSNAKWV
jgi:hypothetical protein